MDTEPILSAATMKAEARRLGFHRCGLAPAEPVDEAYAARYRDWLARGGQADMHYLEAHDDKRFDPRALVPGARTVVSVALNYYPATLLPPDGLQLAWYAYGRDYHDVMRERLAALMQAVRQSLPPQAAEALQGRCFCDTAPVPERYWAQRCGLGWIGKNGQLVIPRAGSTFFLGELFLTLPADRYDEPHPGRCGSCTRCIDACPTGALQLGAPIDARRCLSYLTIENRGDIPEWAARSMDRCLYGCDRCQAACPHLRFAAATDEPDFRPSDELLRMTPADWQRLTEADYRRLFKGSAVKRAKYSGLMRNLQALQTGASTTDGDRGDEPDEADRPTTPEERPEEMGSAPRTKRDAHHEQT